SAAEAASRRCGREQPLTNLPLGVHPRTGGTCGRRMLLYGAAKIGTTGARGGTGSGRGLAPAFAVLVAAATSPRGSGESMAPRAAKARHTPYGMACDIPIWRAISASCSASVRAVGLRGRIHEDETQ